MSVLIISKIDGLGRQDLGYLGYGEEFVVERRVLGMQNKSN